MRIVASHQGNRVERIFENIESLYLACGVTDFRNQITGLSILVKEKFSLNPASPSSIYIFCNRRRNAIKALTYDQNGFLLVTKQLMGDMKFQWPRTPKEIRQISQQQIRWLLEGLEIEPKKAHTDIHLTEENTCY